MRKFVCLLILSLFTVTMASAAAKESQNVKIRVFHAGSLSKPFKDVKKAFEAKYPQAQILLEGGGSRSCARKISDLHQNADVMASADESVITSLLFPDHASFCINFVTNQMSIMYNESSKYADEINSENWHEILLRDGVEYGHSEPEKDPCGYRTILTWQLAEKYYKNPGLFKALKNNCPKKNVRPKEVDLLALLDAGELDYLFIYKSVAEQHHHKYVTLPDEINLGSFALNDYYSSASINLTGKKPGETITVNGAAMVYGITVPANADHPDWGIKLVNFILGPEGRAIMTKNGHPVVNPAETGQYDKLPEELKLYTAPLKK